MYCTRHRPSALAGTSIKSINYFSGKVYILYIVFIFLSAVGMRADILNDMTVALSNDTLAVRDKANEKGESTTPNCP